MAIADGDKHKYGRRPRPNEEKYARQVRRKRFPVDAVRYGKSGTVVLTDPNVFVELEKAQGERREAKWRRGSGTGRTKSRFRVRAGVTALLLDLTRPDLQPLIERLPGVDLRRHPSPVRKFLKEAQKLEWAVARIRLVEKQVARVPRVKCVRVEPKIEGTINLVSDMTVATTIASMNAPSASI